MITVRRSEERGHVELDWLDSRHTFSFGDYYDPEHMGFRALKVINEDRVKPWAGFPTHAHQDMEIITYVLEGALQHRDSMGNTEVLRAGEVQRMTAGTGVRHSEYNPSGSDPLHLLQIWILPETRGLEPSYEQKVFPPEERRGRLTRVAARDDGAAVTVHQDVDLYSAILAASDQVEHELRAGRHAWVQVARGSVSLNGAPLNQGDGTAVSDERRLVIRASEPAEILLFDLA